MKWVLFALALAVVYPLGALMRTRPGLRSWAWLGIGLMPFTVLGFLDINFLSNEEYRGDSRGFEVTLLDLLVLALWGALPRRPEPKPYRLPRYAYFAVAAFSVSQAIEPLFSLFSLWKLGRMYLFLHVLHRGIEEDDILDRILQGASLGILIQLLASLVQRYAFGGHQVSGLFAHQNELSMTVNMVAPVYFALLLGGSRSWWPPVTVAAASLTIVLGLSRGALAVHALVMGATFLMSLMRGPDARKFGVAIAGVAIGALVLAKAGDTILDRFTNAPQASGETRLAMQRAAVLMLSEHPLGVGINQYSLTSDRGNYYKRAAGEQWREGSRETSAIVHNIYRLTAAELGIAGIAIFVWLILAPVWACIVSGWRAAGDIRGDVLLALAIGQLGLHLQGFLEWAFRATPCSYIYWLTVGLGVVLMHQIGRGEAEARE